MGIHIAVTLLEPSEGSLLAFLYIEGCMIRQSLCESIKNVTQDGRVRLDLTSYEEEQANNMLKLT